MRTGRSAPFPTLTSSTKFSKMSQDRTRPTSSFEFLCAEHDDDACKAPSTHKKHTGKKNCLLLEGKEFRQEQLLLNIEYNIYMIGFTLQHHLRYNS
jgi:hypothetical protein